VTALKAGTATITARSGFDGGANPSTGPAGTASVTVTP
jgi:uncharacterized protein YjdB